jgi:hypothetical protein
MQIAAVKSAAKAGEGSGKFFGYARVSSAD